MFTFLTVPILAQYNGEHGSWKGMKWFFYIYYPAHLVVIGIIRVALHDDVPIIFRNKSEVVEVIINEQYLR